MAVVNLPTMLAHGGSTAPTAPDSARGRAADPGAPVSSDGAISTEPSRAVAYSLSGGLIERLAKLNISLAFTSYQSGLLSMLGSSREHGTQIHQSVVVKPMGLAVDRDGLVLAGGASIIRYQNVLKPDEQVNHTFDACYMPRTLHLTGALDAHDIGIDRDDRIVFVNTRYNCLATVSETHSFEPLWRPPFISALVDEDRCHLNGLAMEDGRPAYVTAVSRSDTIDGWRDRRANGGVVLEVGSGALICDGLSMPHSPRLHGGKLWLLNSGTGELGFVGETGRFVPRAFCPGFCRGLAFHDNLAFVGLSKPRHQRFEGLALDGLLRDRDSEPWCGIQVIDLDKGVCVDWFRIDGDVIELYDLAVIAGHRCPMAVSPNSPDVAKLITIAAQAGRPPTTEAGEEQ